ncbi:hypothetical protein JXB41_06265 [Candidatus Woesearchaeota archaeon]|nr:hypothetical protein [Candidatus Woesearchaeota archaeon]
MYLGKEVKVLLKGQAKESYLELKKREDKDAQTLLNSIERVKNILKENPMYGDPVKKSQIPPKLIVEYNITNLYRVELSNYWRMLYSLVGNEVQIFLFVLSIIDHKEYNKLFGYK